ncbi:MAG TPA: RHS repeat-associated core domain-containing protein [Steroidobacteraceae bacterium]|nr:RHS repeat-associated core domain-containing protein [Steroidobacteraceae bacterium]
MLTERHSFLSRAVTWVVLLCFCTTQVVRADEIVYFHNDVAGTPQVATNASGSVLWREHFRPYGDRLDNPAAASTNTVWFTGKPQDASTGLSYMGARYYDPTLGRFSSMDPSAFDEQDLHTLNRYAYANNNPYKYVDPDGRDALAVFVVVAAVLVAIVVIGGSNPPNQQRSRDLARRTESFGAQLMRNFAKQEEAKPPADAPGETTKSGEAKPGTSTEPGTATEPPPGSLPISETPWSGDHDGIKEAIGAKPTDNVKIGPNGEVWVQSPTGEWVNWGKASDITGRDEGSGKTGKDRDRKREEQRQRAREKRDWDRNK